MNHRIPLTIQLEQFEGPLDLLLFLIHSHELNISTVSITRITDQYLFYIRNMKELDFGLASEFLVLAATLLLWKSKAILPDLNAEANEEVEDSILPLTPEDLIRQLQEHEKYLAAGDLLASLPKLHEDVFQRPFPKAPVVKVWKEMNITTLALSFQECLTQSRKRKTVLRKETVSISEKIKKMALQLKMGEMIPLLSLVDLTNIRPETVVTFLASLELSRLKKLRVHQESLYGPILLELIDLITNLELKLATSFEQATAAIEIPEQPLLEENIIL